MFLWVLFCINLGPSAGCYLLFMYLDLLVFLYHIFKTGNLFLCSPVRGVRFAV